MPPKVKITRDMIIDAAFEIARESGIENVNARNVAKRIGCSTQPLLYCFKTMDEIRDAVFERADDYHTHYLMGDGEFSMLNVGLAYVRFAAEEKRLFRLLFQSDHFAKQSLNDLINDESVSPMITAVCRENGITPDEAKDAFTASALLVHGMASLLANNSMEYDPQTVAHILENQFK